MKKIINFILTLFLFLFNIKQMRLFLLPFQAPQPHPPSWQKQNQRWLFPAAGGGGSQLVLGDGEIYLGWYKNLFPISSNFKGY